MSDAKDVLDFNWDSSPNHLAAQLARLGFTVQPIVEGTPDLDRADVYVIPAQNGGAMYAEVEPMDVIASFVAKGGLVVVLPSPHGQAEALKTFVDKALGYSGTWSMCKHVATAARSNLGELAVSSHAAEALPGAWPATVESVQSTSIHTLCKNSDPSASILPLYTTLHNDMETVAQVFGKVGTSGAVAWLGYSWKDGIKDNWGRLLAKLINDFAAGSSALSSAAHTTQQDDMERVIETVAEASVDAAEWQRRMLAVYGSYPPPGPVPNIPITIIPVAPIPVTPAPSPAVTPSPAATPSPTTPAPAGSTAIFFSISALGTIGTTRPLVWVYDSDFSEQKKPRTPANLITLNRARCPSREAQTCYGCPRAFWGWNKTSDSPITKLPLYFPDPVQFSQIQYSPLKNPSLLKVELLEYPVAGLAEGNPSPVGKVTVYDETRDTTNCGETREINIDQSISHINQPVPSQADLSSKAYGGVLLTFKAAARKGAATYVDEVTFAGRVLYPTRAYKKRK